MAYVMRSYRLEPTCEQAEVFRKWAGAMRLVWNSALEQRTIAWEFNRGRAGDRCWAAQPRPSYMSQARELTEARREYAWLAAVPSQLFQQKLLDLDAAFARFFAGRAGHPVRKRKRRSTDSFRFPDPSQLSWQRVSRHTGRVKLPKLGWVRFRWSREVCDSRRGERSRHLTVIRKTDGWHAVFCVATSGETGLQDFKDAVVGVDRGCTVAVATSDGELLDLQSLTRGERLRYKRLQRKLARQQRSSRRFQRTRRRIGLLAERAASRRKEFAYQIAHRFARDYGVVVLERLKVRSMTRSARGTVHRPGRNVRQKAGLNRSILDKGWGVLRRRLSEVCPANGCELRFVPAAWTSTRCRKCGYTDPGNRESQTLFRCRLCGWYEHADIHAAKNIKDLGTVGWKASRSAPADGRAAAGRSSGRIPFRTYRNPAAEASTHGARDTS